MAPGQISKIEDIPYLDKEQLKRSRFVPSMMFHVDGQWRLWVQTGDDAVVEMLGEPAESYYFSAAPEKEGDFTTIHLNFIAQHALISGLTRSFGAFQDDLFNLAASLAKLDLIHASGSSARSRMACTEVEYILTVCRSMFDLLQEMLACLWENVRLTDPTTSKRALKRSFAEMALKGSAPRAAADIARVYGLPKGIAECYARHAPLFLRLRKFRDDLVHKGYAVRALYTGDDGFLIARNLGPFEDIRVWRDDEMEPNELGPLKPVLGLLIHNLLWACNDFVEQWAKVIQYPSALVPGMVYYSRGDSNAQLLAALRDAQDRLTEGRGLPGGAEFPVQD